MMTPTPGREQRVQRLADAIIAESYSTEPRSAAVLREAARIRAAANRFATVDELKGLTERSCAILREASARAAFVIDDFDNETRARLEALIRDPRKPARDEEDEP